ncbi:MAG: glutamate synthase large subunit [Candidatus Erginobacter occultus]|nr:glutamate synthase large subunit [Candidatus Erginobacter occultus]
MNRLGIYDSSSEQDSCGVGFVADLSGNPRHSLVRDSLAILVNLEHRGAVGGDKNTGDGAGIMTALPDEFFRREFAALGVELPAPGDYAVGMIFAPPGESGPAGRALLEKIAGEEGLRLPGWREVPVRPECLGELALSTRPEIFQAVLTAPGLPAEVFARKLYVVRRRAEKEIGGPGGPGGKDFYVCSLSPRTVVYKGMFTASQIAAFFPDLEDPAFASAFAVIHQRYSTNTLPTWKLAQPFRYAAHNGEINTLRGNSNRMRAREPDLSSGLFGDDLAKILPAIAPGGSDSAVFDNVLELLSLSGRSLPHALMMMIPEAWGVRYRMSEDKRAFYEYHSAVMEPWDGPAAIVFCDGRYLGATLDRNGLRPARYTVTRDGLVVLASETGVLDIDPAAILQRGRLQPGKMFLVDLEGGRVIPDNEIKARISRRRPYRRWVRENRIELRGFLSPAPAPGEDPAALLRQFHAFGYTDEDFSLVLRPMAARGQEAIGSMGHDTALAVFSPRPQLLYNYFKQLFAQVTNPAIDPLREELVMSLMNWLGREGNLLEEAPAHCRRLKLPHPVLTGEDLDRLRCSTHQALKPAEIEILFPAAGDPGKNLATALERVFAAAESAIASGATVLILSDRGVSRERAAIPALLAAAGLHHHLIRKGLRSRAGIVVETGEAREVMHFSLLIGYGANAVCPYLAFSAIRDLAENRLLEKAWTPEEAMDNYVTAVKKGLLKTFSRMGISTIRSYCGAQIFEAVGLKRELVERYFSGTDSRIEGAGLAEIAAETRARHRQAFPATGEPAPLLPAGSSYRYRRPGEKHLWTPEAIAGLQRAVRTSSYDTFRQYAAGIDEQSAGHLTLRSLFAFTGGDPVPLEEVEPEAEILKRFASAAMSFGSLGKEAHETIAEAMNRLGAASNSGEGGEDPSRGESRASRIRQVASGRFGVDPAYLLGAREIQIKIAQGAKPGEGGQLPGHKVTVEIARVRHTTPGVTLISPPPHHDIYSIEDLSQLIFDLKAVNPQALVSVKLVSEAGVGTVAAGVAKAGADKVIIAGYDGGTGSSPLTSIRHAGLPWELGLAETQQALVFNRLRDRIRVQTDGQLRTGRDVVIAALLGAEEFCFGTSVLVALGCALVRKCHLNTCPMGIATQDPELRKRFKGRPEDVENFFRFLARSVREIMASLGFRTMEEMIGRVERLKFQPATDHPKSRGVDLSGLLALPEANGTPRHFLRSAEANGYPFDELLIERARPALERGEKVKIELAVKNVHRAVGARLSGEIVRRRGPGGLADETIRVELTGSAGQSFGAFLAPGVTLRLFGEANDYLGKGMSGGRIIVTPSAAASFYPHENVIAGNTLLYGATGGEVYLDGTAGERFAVRNSGATAVVDRIGDHGCEYMTGGTVVVLGKAGNNFGAGMSGGAAYVFDESELFDTRCNLDMVDLESVWRKEDRLCLRELIEKHRRLTGSGRAGWILENWDSLLPLFVKVMPIDYRRALERMRLKEDVNGETVSATEEVYDG